MRFSMGINYCKEVFIEVGLKFRLSHKEKEHEQPPFRVPFNIKNIPVPTVLALLSTLVFFGYNIYNILEGF